MANDIEYIVSATILMLIVSLSTSLAFVYVNPPKATAAQQQILNRCETLLEQIIGSSGRPKDWGSSITYRPTDIQEFGLALEGYNRTDSYDLDSDKVNRLIDPDFRITSDQLSKLLDISNEYLFNLKISPALTMTIKPTQSVLVGGKSFFSQFDVTVTTHDNRPLPNVNMSAMAIIAYSKTGLGGTGVDVVYYDSDVFQSVTDWNGTGSFDLTSFFITIEGSPVGAILEVFGRYYGTPMVKCLEFAENPDDTFVAKMIGNQILVDIPVDNNPPKGAKHMKKRAMVVTLDESASMGTIEDNVLGMIKMNDGLVNYGSKNYKSFTLSSDEPNVYCVSFVVKSIGKNKLVVAYTLPEPFEVGYKIPTSGSTPMAQARRMVMIRGTAYYVQLTLWKASEF